jgi:hypothetical protein
VASGSTSAYRHSEFTRPVSDFSGAGVGEKSRSRGPRQSGQHQASDPDGTRVPSVGQKESGSGVMESG